jgi:hypothetical protein
MSRQSPACWRELSSVDVAAGSATVVRRAGGTRLPPATDLTNVTWRRAPYATNVTAQCGSCTNRVRSGTAPVGEVAPATSVTRVNSLHPAYQSLSQYQFSRL